MPYFIKGIVPTHSWCTLSKDAAKGNNIEPAATAIAGSTDRGPSVKGAYLSFNDIPGEPSKDLAL